MAATKKIMNVLNYAEAIKLDWSFEDTEFIPSVREILEDVKKRGDEAVAFYNKKYDDIELRNTELTKEEIEKAYSQVDKKVVSALKDAAANIKSFAEAQMSQIKALKFEKNGVEMGHKVIPIHSVGCYVPGGNYPLPSTALMSVIPARVAGVSNVIICSPKIKPVTVVAADIAGVNRIFNLGGVQAIGAMAYGTKTIPRVDKIVGPGSKYVAAAKKEVYGKVGIDFLAGPSEVLIIADEEANPAYLAADLLAQAEHDINSRANLITTSRNLEEKVQAELIKQLGKLGTREIAEQSIRKGNIIIVDNLEQAVVLSNLIAPEHLELQIKEPEKLESKLRNYGSLFIGPYSAEVFGDYCSGPNHTLPTGGSAKYTGGLSVKEFLKFPTYQKASPSSIFKLIETASTLAKAEGLDAHRNAAEIRRTK